MSKLHWVPAWSDDEDVADAAPTSPLKTACGRRVKLPLRAGTSDRDFSCDPQGRCERCLRAWRAL